MADAPRHEHDPRGFGIGVTAVLLTLAGWGVTPLFIKHFAGHIDAWTSNGWRYGFAALLWAPLLIVLAARRRLPERLWSKAIAPGAINSAAQVAFAAAHYKIDPGLLTFGLRSQIVCVTIGAALMFPAERAVIRRPAFLIGLVMVAAGTAGTASLGEKLTADQWLGVALAVLAGAGFAGYALAVRRQMRGVNPMTAFAAISQYTGLAMIVLMLTFGERSGMATLALDGGQIALLLLSSIIGIALGHVGYYLAISRLGVTASSGVIQLQPFLTAAASRVVFDEHLRALQWVAGTVAVSGAVLMLMVQRAAHRRLIAAGATRAGEAEAVVPLAEVSVPAPGGPAHEAVQAHPSPTESPGPRGRGAGRAAPPTTEPPVGPPTSPPAAPASAPPV